MTATLRAPARTGSSRPKPRTPARTTPNALRHKASPSLRVVNESARRRQHARSVIFRIAALTAVVVVLAALVFQAFLSQGQIRLRTLTVETQDAQSAYQSQRLAYAEASAPSKIASRAANLGLIRGPIPRFISVDGVVFESRNRDLGSTSSTSSTNWGRVKSLLETRP
jgi:hypothetical protein